MKQTIIFKLSLYLVLLVLVLSLVSCRHDREEGEPERIIKVVFSHQVNGNPIQFDTMTYLNLAGNPYEVTEVQWFISDVMVDILPVSQDSGIHYVDTNIPSTLTWIFRINQKVDEQASLTFTFGLKGEKNTVGRFPDPPESNMIWPYHMGGDHGGYHYMKFNGFWRDSLNVRQPFNFHLGVGKVVNPNNDSPEYVQNWFEVNLPLSKSDYLENDTLCIPIVMNIENWFENPHTWDFDQIGGKIMDNQAAMKMGCENGEADVFSLADTDNLRR